MIGKDHQDVRIPEVRGGDFRHRGVALPNFRQGAHGAVFISGRYRQPLIKHICERVLFGLYRTLRRRNYLNERRRDTQYEYRRAAGETPSFSRLRIGGVVVQNNSEQQCQTEGDREDQAVNTGVGEQG